MEDTMAVLVLGNFLIMVGTICFSVISAVEVMRNLSLQSVPLRASKVNATELIESQK
jgi:hypothetical protein